MPCPSVAVMRLMRDTADRSTSSFEMSSSAADSVHSD